MDDQLNEIQRTSTLTVGKVFTDVGGLNSTLVFILTFFFSRYIELSYYRSVANKIYKYNQKEFNETPSKELRDL